MSTRRATLLLVLAACTPQRPKNAYTSVWRDGGDKCAPPADGIPSPCSEAGAATDDDEPPEEDAGLDATTVEPDTGPLPTTVEGTYLMRVDYYSTANGSEGGVTLTVKNRISNLFLITLTPGGEGALQSTEQLCLQTSQHVCQNNTCSGWTTTYDTALPALYAEKSKLQRTWTLDSASKLLTVKADGATLALGYDPNGTDFTLPSAVSDANVWQPGTNAQAAVHTFVSASVKTPLGSMPFTCNINSALVFGTAFSATLSELTAQGMNKLVVPVDAAGTDARILYAKSPDTGTLASACDKSKLETGTTSDPKVFVRFWKTTLPKCPTTAAAYDKAFNDFPSQSVDPP